MEDVAVCVDVVGDIVVVVVDCDGPCLLGTIAIVL